MLYIYIHICNAHNPHLWPLMNICMLKRILKSCFFFSMNCTRGQPVNAICSIYMMAVVKILGVLFVCQHMCSGIFLIQTKQKKKKLLYKFMDHIKQNKKKIFMPIFSLTRIFFVATKANIHIKVAQAFSFKFPYLLNIKIFLKKTHTELCYRMIGMREKKNTVRYNLYF